MSGSARAWLKQDPELGSGRPNLPMLTAYIASPDANMPIPICRVADIKPSAVGQ